ncbi:SIS domain-containing protein [Simiduia aestuariiviva]|uniref:D-sedoheptulose 7-phosphate isomerase n=1 Tax=Simiduia aestuariiviva TaxID=1510459 RepID=A0A839URM4_9GAMM|nr:SIS domain-containing protein [Simiduia aestuariiviva]MBB3169119.1 D-sedoheptulose 7-phosphate isomerase [Simiduia aestuariiviva]
MEQRVIQLFHESIEATMNAGELFAPLLVDASQLIVNALLQERKLLVCGNGIAHSNAEVLTACLVNRFEQERPSLPAMTLGCDATVLNAIANETSYNDVYAKQIRALGNAGDILVVFAAGGNSSNLVQAVSAAHDKEITVVAFTGQNVGDTAAILDAQDIELRVPAEQSARIQEVHLLSVFCLCDLIDRQLFGGYA